MDTEELFIRTLDDLERCISSNDDYTILHASALIRKLFLDESPLVDQVNQIIHAKLKFEVVDTDKLFEVFQTPDMPKFEFLGIQDALDPESIPNPPKKTVTRDAFFKVPIQVAQGRRFTIQEIVKHQANIEGGVHAGKSKTADDRKLEEVEDTIKIFSLPPGLRQLQAIGRIILKTLFPLKIITICNKRISVNPNDVAAYYNRGTAYAICGNLEKAIRDFDRAIKSGQNHPQLADIYYNRGGNRSGGV